ncbi:MAG: hypothetical protein L0215_27080 [Gemmataceae bacterium]|nr:hypothetical protein [Gemmataceae bacterium]
MSSPIPLVRLVLAGAAFFSLTVSAQAQQRLFPLTQPGCDPCAPKATDPSQPPRMAPEQVPALGPVTTAALGGDLMSFGPGYLDNPVPFSHFRLRLDAAYRNNRPDRAEFFYPKCGCFPDGPGPLLPETSVDYQDISAYFEWAPRDWFSVFVEFPFRFINPEQNPNTSGWADFNGGVKVALWCTGDSILTFQGRVYMPVGDGRKGLGTEHVSFEPSLLYGRNLTDRLVLFGQLGDWISLGGTDFAGNVLRYGAGVSYTAFDNGRASVAPVVEVLGWTVLDGLESFPPQNLATDASGDTIINAKFGVRFGLGRNSDLYLGYGRALTGDVWYRDIYRLEYRLRF